MDQVSIPVLIAAVGNLGFPIILTGYLLVRFEKKIEVLSHAIETLKKCSRK